MSQETPAKPLVRIAQESRARSIAKTLTWRIVATFTTFVIAWTVTGNAKAGVAIGGIEAFAKLGLYYMHERAWAGVGCISPKGVLVPSESS